MARRRKGHALPRTLGALIQQYRASPEFKRLRPETQKAYYSGFKMMAVGDGYLLPVSDIRRGHVMWLRDEYQAKPGMANRVVQTLSALMSYAVKLEWRENNPCRGVELMPKGSYRRWPVEAIQHALTAFPERFQRAVLLALYTGQREGDLCAMRWSDYDGQGIQVTQGKTGAKVWIPCHAALTPHLEAWKADRAAVTILTDNTGKPWKASSFASTFSREIHKHPEMAGLVFHGLRKVAAANLAEAGCSTHEIMAITGHRTLAMIQHYTAEVEQKASARAAITRLENYRPGKR